jgi:hypothetical protein
VLRAAAELFQEKKTLETGKRNFFSTDEYKNGTSNLVVMVSF